MRVETQGALSDQVQPVQRIVALPPYTRGQDLAFIDCHRYVRVSHEYAMVGVTEKLIVGKTIRTGGDDIAVYHHSRGRQKNPIKIKRNGKKYFIVRNNK